MRGNELFSQLARRPPFTKLHPRVASFFREYLAGEKVTRFGDQQVINTHFPPYPSRAFDSLAEGFASLGDAARRRLYSVTLAVTNRCPFNCWHCYNAGRSQDDMPLETLANLADDLQSLGAVMITLTGGEPLLRDDLEDIVGLFDGRSCLALGTTGAGLNGDRAKRLRDRGLFAIGVSLDSHCSQVHDHLRGREGAFQSAIQAIGVARQSGLYPYVVSVATREFLQPQHFRPFMRLAADIGALEVHLLEPAAAGRLSGRTDVLLSGAERVRIFQYQRAVAEDPAPPILSSYAYLEGPDAFGCGAGLTHLYIDGSGEVCPCQLVPLSFGNVSCEPLGQILDRMGEHFVQPRANCVGRLLAGRLPDGRGPLPPEESVEQCRRCLPASHQLPRFFKIRSEATEKVGQADLRAAYDRVHDDYDDFWLTEAAGPIDAVIERLPTERGRVFEAGCGTGYATGRLAPQAASLLAVDVSQGMLQLAGARLRSQGVDNVELIAGDALGVLQQQGRFDLIFSSWVLGYIPLAAFFSASRGHLVAGGHLAFVVHKENSPREPLEIFAELVAQDPSVLEKQVAFDFPRNAEHTAAEIKAAGLEVQELWEGAVVFRYDRAEAVLEHLLKSGAGTAYYDAVRPDVRDALAREFVKLLSARQGTSSGLQVRHDYVACIAVKR